MRVPKIVLVVALIASALAAPAAAPARHIDRIRPGDGVPDGGPRLEAAPAASPRGHLYPWRGTPTDVPGTWTYSAGEFILSDHPYDDHGADLDGDDGIEGNPAERYPMLYGANAAEGAAGDYVYPEGLENAADIVELRLAADDDAYHLLAIFNAMTDASRTGLYVTLFGTFHGRTEVPGIVAHGSTGRLRVSPSSPIVPLEVVADEHRNTLEIRIPRADLGADDDRIGLWAGAGIWDPERDRFDDTYATPWFDVAYQREEPMTSYWRDLTQSRHLSEEHTVPVDLTLLDCEDRCPPVATPAPPSGWFTRTFRSGQDLGEGISPQTRWDQHTSFPYKLYRGRYQPYAMYVPPHTNGSMVLLLHFLAGNHMSFPITSAAGIEEWADRLGTIVVMPMARGEAGWYGAEAEKDVFEVWRDVAMRYPVDRERVYLMGMSMGGFGTWRLGHLYPDQFARAIVWSGPVTPYSIWPSPAPAMWPQQNPPMCDRDADGCGYNLTDLFGNASPVPYMVVHGAADELVPISGVESWMQRYAREGGSSSYVVYATRQHDTSFPGAHPEQVLSWLHGLPTRATDPSRVTYTVLADLEDDEHGLDYTRAYWLSDLRRAADATEARVVAELEGPHHSVTGEGTHSSAGPRDVYHAREVYRSLYEADGGTLALRLTGFDRAAVDTARIGWDPAEPQSLIAYTDRDVTLVLRGDFAPGVAVSGAPFHRRGSAIVLSLPAGVTEVGIG